MLGTEKVVRYSLLAAERALATYANEEALSHFQRALAAKGAQAPWPSSGKVTDAETAALLFGLGRAQAATLERHRLHEAVNTMTPALNYYAETEQVDRAVAIAQYPFYPLIGQPTGKTMPWSKTSAMPLAAK